jgi:hypothetical protein
LRVDDILVCPILLTGDVNACSASATVLVTCLFVGLVRVRWTRGTGETRNISFEAMATGGAARQPRGMKLRRQVFLFHFHFITIPNFNFNFNFTVSSNSTVLSHTRDSDLECVLCYS